jgi:hypothetical protein
MAIAIDRFHGRNGKNGLRLYGVKGARLRDVRLEDYSGGVTFGDASATQACRDIDAEGLSLIRCATGSTIAMVLGNVAEFDLANSRIDDCGAGDGIAIFLAGGATTSALRFRRVKVVTPTGLTDYAVLVDGSHTQTPSSNRKTDCDFGGLTDQLKIGNPRGIATMVAGEATVVEPGITANSKIKVWRKTPGGTVAASYDAVLDAGVGFDIEAKDGAGAAQTADTSIVHYEVEP